MDFRCHSHQPVRITLLNDSAQPISATMTPLQGRRVQIEMPEFVPAGSPVRIDYEDSLLIGEVDQCFLDRETSIITVEVREVIPSVSDLTRLVSAVMYGSHPVRPAAELATAAAGRS